MRPVSVLVVGASPDALAPSVLAGLAREHDRILAVDGGYGHLERAGIAADLLIGDLDSITSRQLESARAAADVERHPAEKDESDLTLALRACERLGAASVTLAGVTGGRIDHELVSLGVITRFAHLRPVVRGEGHTARVLSAEWDATAEFSQVGQVVSVIALPGPAVVSISGFKWEAVRLRLAPLDDRGLSNVVSSAGARVTLDAGVAVTVALDAP